MLTLLHFTAHHAVPIDGAGEAHAQIDLHAIVTHDPVQVVPETIILKRGQEAQTSQAKGQCRWHNALEQPACKQHGAVTTQRQHQVEFLRLAPAQIGRPVLEHVLEARVLVHNALRIEPLRVAQLGIHIDIDAQVRPVARRAQKPLGQLTRQQDKRVVTGFGDNHDVAHGALNGTALQLFADFAHTSGCLHESGVRHPFVVLDFLENFVNVYDPVEALVVEAGRLQRGKGGGGSKSGGNAPGMGSGGVVVRKIVESVCKLRRVVVASVVVAGSLRASLRGRRGGVGRHAGQAERFGFVVASEGNRRSQGLDKGLTWDNLVGPRVPTLGVLRIGTGVGDLGAYESSRE